MGMVWIIFKGRLCWIHHLKLHPAREDLHCFTLVNSYFSLYDDKVAMFTQIFNLVLIFSSLFSTDSMGEVPAYQGKFPSFRVPKDMCSVDHSRIFPSSSCEAVSIQLRLKGNSYVLAVLGVML